MVSLFRFFKNITLVCIASLSAFAAYGFDNTFDSCVDQLHSNGGLSKAEGRKHCIRGISQEVLSCQNKKFLIDFLTPQEALAVCKENPTPENFKNYNYYKGTYEPMPANDQRKTVCSVTVNSNDEREAFRSELDPTYYKWVELLPQNPTGGFIPRNNIWIKRACEQKIKCDIMVFSGHFASTFLGESGFEVKLEDLTKFSCGSDCKDLFDSVSQVYLFGCNTLSEKNQDSRTPSEYRNILVEDGLTPHTAQRIAARRYTPYGMSIREEIRHVFPNAKQIFGYEGPGPTGPSIKNKLKTFIKTAYAPNTTVAEVQSIFKTTLGPRMFAVSGLARTEHSCLGSREVTSDQKLLEIDGLKKYANKFGRELPIPTLDLIFESEKKGLITPQQRQSLSQALVGVVSESKSANSKALICPLLATEYANLVPEKLNCLLNLNWLQI